MTSRTKKKAAPMASAPGLLPDEKPDILQEVADLIDKPNEWLNTASSQLGGRKPKDFIGTDQEPLLRDLLRAIKYGMPT